MRDEWSEQARWARLASDTAREWLDADDKAPGRWVGVEADDPDEDDDLDDLIDCIDAIDVETE